MNFFVKIKTTLEVIRECAASLAKTYGRQDELELLANIEKLGCPLIEEQKNLALPVCANVDLYSGFVYDMLGIPYDLYTPGFRRLFLLL